MFNTRATYRRLKAKMPKPGEMTKYIILPMGWIRQYETEDLHHLTGKCDIRDIIRSITSVPIQLDYEDSLYDELDKKGVFDDAENETVSMITLFLTVFVEHLYDELKEIIFCDDLESYTFHSWVDDYSLMMVRNDVPVQEAESLADHILSAREGLMRSDYVV